MNPKYYLLLSLILLFTALLSAETTVAECKNCKKLRQAKYLGIVPSKQFLLRSQSITILSTERRAKRRGLQKFVKCTSAQTRASNSNCNPAFAILSDNVYLCPKQLKAFSSQAQAENKGYVSYSACQTPTPTATATPIVTPKSATLSFSIESGTCFSDVDSISVLSDGAGGFRSYSAASNSTSTPDTLRFSTAADGLIFGSKTAVSGISPDSDETFGNPSVIRLDNGTYVMIYEEIKHVSSAAVDINNLFRAVSSDGITFTNDPTSVVISNGSLISSFFNPSLLLTGASTQKLYYTFQQALKFVDSVDGGTTWGEEQSVAILGRGDNYAPYPDQPAVVLNGSGTYYMFFTSIATTNSNNQGIYWAESSDGKTFYIYDKPALEPPSSSSYTDPSIVVLPNGSLRIYFVERSGELGNQVRAVKSALSQPN